MYLAELHGKLTSRIERREDILTSNVFSFFKYSDREIFLKEYLNNEFGFNITNQEANKADFIFWPRFEENTEPDLVIIVGDYYLLIEAKYFSGFAEETRKTKAQLIREIYGGKREAKNYDKDFWLIVITADHYYKKDKFKTIPPELKHHFKWTNWQSVSRFLYNILESDINIKKQERDFASDLYNLLDKKKLRDFQGFNYFYNNISIPIKKHTYIFFETRTAKFCGAFIGFTQGLPFKKKILQIKKTIFLANQREIFTSLLRLGKLKYIKPHIFYNGERNHDYQK